MKLDEVKSWKNRYKENLVDLGWFQDLEIIEKDERLKTFLNTPLKKIIDRGNELGHSYSHAFMGNWESFFDKTLLEIFSRIAEDTRGRIRFYVSEDKDIEGIIFYTTKKRNKKEFVENIFVISTDLSRNSLILAKDLHALFLQLIKEYDFVRWEADFENPSCRVYKRICTSMRGTWGFPKKRIIS